MRESFSQWVIKLESDQVKGPYTTESLIKMIINGAFSGSEEICSYPEGEWTLLAKQPEFYDALLESLENPVEVDNKRAQKMEAETVIRVSDRKNNEEIPIPRIDVNNELKEFIKNELIAEQNRQSIKKLAKIRKASNVATLAPDASEQGSLKKLAENKLQAARDKNLEIQLSDIKRLKQKEINKLLPLMLAVIVLLAAAVYYSLSAKEDIRTGWFLLAAKKTKHEPLAPEEMKSTKRKIVKAFQGGRLEQVLKAQRDLVKAVEAAPKDLEALGLLCMVYQQLWPYTKQTQEDLKAITIATQMARSVNPISNYSDLCQSVYLLTKGQSKEARALIEKALEALDSPLDEKFSLGAFLYLIKAEILESENNFLHASAYYESTTKLWPAWVTAKFGLARTYYKQSKFAEAREQYAEIYKINNASKAALFGLALSELKSSKNIDKAHTYFENGFAIKEQIPKDFSTEALLSYVQILINKNEKTRALQVAQEGYRASPSHRGLKEMVISLDGDAKVEDSLAEVILIGDQFARAGDHLVAQAQYKAAFDLDPKNSQAAYKAAKSLWKINQSRNAILWLEKSIKANPKMLQAYVLKADYESQKFNFPAATRTLQHASRYFSRNHEVIKAQAQIEFRKNNMATAIQYGERAVKIYNADVELLSLLAQAHISYYMHGPSAGKGEQEKKENSKKLAERYAGRVIDIEPAWPEGQITFAKVLSGVYGPVRAESYLKNKIKEYPYTTEYRVALAEFYRENEKYSNAAVIYEEVVAIEPENKRANFGLAETYRILNKSLLAQQYYNLSSVLDPSDVEPMVANAKLLLETAAGNEVKAKIEQALAKLVLAKKINPDFPKVSLLMARCYFDLNDYQNALVLIKEEKSRNPNVADSYILAAEIFYRKSQFKECAAEYSSAIKLRPAIAELYVKSAICYRYSDSIDIAEDMLAIALQKESGYPEIYREQAYIFEKKNNKSGAILSFEKYLTLSPNAVDREIVEAKIRELGG